MQRSGHRLFLCNLRTGSCCLFSTNIQQRLNIHEASVMRIHLQSADVVAIIAIALFTALMLAVRFRTTSWRGIVLQALIANAGAIAAVVAFEVMTT